MASGAPGSQRSMTQSKEAMLQEYKIRLKRDVRSITDNYVAILKLASLKVRILFLFCRKVTLMHVTTFLFYSPFDRFPSLGKDLLSVYNVMLITCFITSKVK